MSKRSRRKLNRSHPPGTDRDIQNRKAMQMRSVALVNGSVVRDGDITQILASDCQALWLDICNPDESTEQMLRDAFKFHPLAIEDAIRQTHIPKVDDWETYLYIVLAGLHSSTTNTQPEQAEVDIFLGPNYIVTLRECEVPSLERVFKQACERRAQLEGGADHLLYLLVDALVGDFLSIIDDFDEQIDDYDMSALYHPDPSMLSSFFTLRHHLLELRRIVSPLREVLSRLSRDDYSQIDPQDRVYFRDVYDHLVRLMEIIESLRELVQGGMETYLSAVSNKLNTTMQTLTIVTVIFAPLSFMTGFFGMNFFGGTYEISSGGFQLPLFVLVCALMTGIPFLMLLWMKHRRWF